MNVRDALEADADALASIAGSPTDVMRNLVHDRTVRVAEVATNGAPSAPADEDCAGTHEQSGAVDGAASQYGGSDPDDLLGFVSFDAEDDTVHVTQIDGTEAACERLLAEPVRFAEREGMAVEVLVPVGQETVTDALERKGFDRRGFGPRFDGSRTIRFRLNP